MRKHSRGLGNVQKYISVVAEVKNIALPKTFPVNAQNFR